MRDLRLERLRLREWRKDSRAAEARGRRMLQ
jgi:hypothetical protein